MELGQEQVRNGWDLARDKRLNPERGAGSALAAFDAPSRAEARDRASGKLPEPFVENGPLDESDIGVPLMDHNGVVGMFDAFFSLHDAEDAELGLWGYGDAFLDEVVRNGETFANKGAKHNREMFLKCAHAIGRALGESEFVLEWAGPDLVLTGDNEQTVRLSPE